MMSLPKNAGRRRGEAEGALAVNSPRKACAPQGPPWPWLRSSRLLPSGIYDSLLGQRWLAPPEMQALQIAEKGREAKGKVEKDPGWGLPRREACSSCHVPSCGTCSHLSRYGCCALGSLLHCPVTLCNSCCMVGRYFQTP